MSDAASRPTALIVGCGDLGSEVGLRLDAGGHRVVGWRRGVPAGASPIEFRSVDVLHPVALGLTALDVLVIALAPRRNSSDVYERTYLDGVRHALQALEVVGVAPRRAVLVSSTSVYGDATGRITEETPINDASGRAAVQLSAETRFLSYFADRSTSAAVLRCGGIYGPGRDWLVNQVRDGSAVIPLEPAKTSRIHRDDAAAAVVHLLTRAEELESVYLGVDDEPAELGDVLRFIADRLGVPHPPTGHTQRRRGGNRECSNARLRAAGFEFEFPDFRSGYAAELSHPRPRHP